MAGAEPQKASPPRGKGANILYRSATATDGAEMWTFVKRAGVLERNPSYAYILLCQHFGDTCLVADREGEMVGFVLAYIPPRQPDTVFVWQVGVAKSTRGLGVGQQLLRHLMALSACRNVRYLEASVTQSNKASQNLFRGFARRWGTSCRKLPFFPSEFFPESHESEHLLRVGPIEWPEA